MVYVTDLVFALLRWSLSGPVEVTNRFVHALVKRGAIASDSLTEARVELFGFLEKLTPPEQRRFVYEVARDTFGGSQLVVCWDSSVVNRYVGSAEAGQSFTITDAVLAQLCESDASTLRVVISAIVACAVQIPSLQRSAIAAEAWLKSSGENCAPALAELLLTQEQSRQIADAAIGIDEHRVTLDSVWRDMLSEPCGV